MKKINGLEYYSLEETSNILDERIKIRAKNIVKKITLKNQKKLS